MQKRIIYILPLIYLLSCSHLRTTNIKDAKRLVHLVCKELKVEKASKIFDKINRAEHPYRDKDDPALYVFVYDTKGCLVADYQNSIRGECLLNKTDIKGKKYRKEIVEGAKSKGKGFVTYYYLRPYYSGIHKKKAYYKMCSSQKEQYIVVSGAYMND